MPWARASALEHHMECAAASWLPRLERGVWRRGYLDGNVTPLDPQLYPPPTEPENTSYAEHGTAMHSAKAGTGVDPYNVMWEGLRDEFYPPNLGVHEQAVSYDCRTGLVELGPTNRPIEEMDAWKNSRGDDCVVGTCDWWGELPSGEPWVDDLKTGWRTPDVVTPQTLFYLLLRCRVAAWELGRISITHWPQKEPVPTRDNLWRSVNRFALEGFEADLQLAWKRAVVIPSPQAKVGPWCGYCKSAPGCPKALEQTETETSETEGTAP